MIRARRPFFNGLLGYRNWIGTLDPSSGIVIRGDKAVTLNDIEAIHGWWTGEPSGGKEWDQFFADESNRYIRVIENPDGTKSFAFNTLTAREECDPGIISKHQETFETGAALAEAAATYEIGAGLAKVKHVKLGIQVLNHADDFAKSRQVAGTVNKTLGGPINNIHPSRYNCVQCAMAVLHNKFPANHRPGLPRLIGANGTNGAAGIYGETWGDLGDGRLGGTLNPTQVLNYIEDGLGLTKQCTVRGDFFQNATEPGNYVIMNSKHIINAMITPNGRKLAYDGQTHSSLTDWNEVKQIFPAGGEFYSYLLR